MKNILLPLGNNDRFKTNLPYVIEIARLLNATVYVARLFKELPRSGGLLEGNPTVEEITTQELEQIISQHDTKGVEVVAKPLEGDEWVEAVGRFNQAITTDLIVLTPKHHNINEEHYLGSVAGALLKKTEIPVLIVPDDYVYRPIQRILMAVKSGIVHNPDVLKPLVDIQEGAGAEIRLLQVKTPDYLEEDSEFNTTLGKLVSSYKSSENATLFQGLLEHLNANDPDFLCVFRRKRGFFTKLWEEDAVKKVDFESRLPLLVLKDAE